MANFCTVTREDQILIVTMNRPDKRNAMPPESHLEMEKIWDEFGADPGLRVGILTGRRLSAAEAHRHGLVNRVVPQERVLDAARELARSILRSEDLREGINAFFEKRAPRWLGR